MPTSLTSYDLSGTPLTAFLCIVDKSLQMVQEQRQESITKVSKQSLEKLQITK